jgi:hypothetical protein
LNEAQRLMQSYGLQARPDLEQHDYPKLRHTGDLDALRRRAIDAGPESVEYAQWVAALQQGADEHLPDAGMMGAIPMSIEDQAGRLHRAQRQSERRWVSVHPLLQQVHGPNGIPLADLPAAHAHTMAAMLAADGQREAAQRLTDAIHLSESSSMGVVVEQPDEDHSYHVARDQRSSSGDPYVEWRRANQQQRQGISALQIQSPDEASLYAGITSPDGLSYEVSADWSLNSSGNSDD